MTETLPQWVIKAPQLSHKCLLVHNFHPNTRVYCDKLKGDNRSSVPLSQSALVLEREKVSSAILHFICRLAKGLQMLSYLNLHRIQITFAILFQCKMFDGCSSQIMLKTMVLKHKTN